jgi:hypothetical protein
MLKKAIIYNQKATASGGGSLLERRIVPGIKQQDYFICLHLEIWNQSYEKF